MGAGFQQTPLGFRLSQGGTKKTRQVTLPPLFSGRDSNPPLAARRPSRENEPRAELCGDWLTCRAAGSAKANSEARWGLRSGWESAHVLRHLEG